MATARVLFSIESITSGQDYKILIDTILILFPFLTKCIRCIKDNGGVGGGEGAGGRFAYQFKFKIGPFI